MTTLKNLKKVLNPPSPTYTYNYEPNWLLTCITSSLYFSAHILLSDSDRHSLKNGRANETRGCASRSQRLGYTDCNQSCPQECVGVIC